MHFKGYVAKTHEKASMQLLQTEGWGSLGSILHLNQMPFQPTVLQNEDPKGDRMDYVIVRS